MESFTIEEVISGLREALPDYTFERDGQEHVVVVKDGKPIFQLYVVSSAILINVMGWFPLTTVFTSKELITIIRTKEEEVNQCEE